MIYEFRWYNCVVEDSYNIETEPDWSKIPEVKRDKIRLSWENKFKAEIGTWKLWGPQINWYNQQKKYKITVVE